MTETTIVIVGAGIAGLATALALAPMGEVLVLERRGALASNEGAGIQIPPNAVKALATLGAAERVVDAAYRPAGLSVFSGTRPVTRLPYGSAFEARFGAPSLTTGRAALHRALLDEVLNRPNVTVVADRPVERVERTGDGWILPGLGGAARGARWLVAADGVNSAIRRSLRGEEPRDAGWVAWRGRGAGGRDTRLTDTGLTDTNLFMAPGAHLVRYAMAGGESSGASNAVFIAPVGRSPSDDAPLRPALRSIEDWVPWPVKVHPRHVFDGDAVAYVGDAAHAMVPFLAQGAAMALEDAAMLGLCAQRHGLTPDALVAYRTARARRTRQVADASDQQGRIYHMRPPLSFARNAVMANVGASGILRRVDWLFRWTPA